jgi:hypothetical protein
LHYTEIKNTNLKKDINTGQTVMLIKDDQTSLYFEVYN